ncbi:LTBP1 protein, partial [Polypterus senegalus]|nr:LTBP1 protein [Polypterus senegalus]
MNGGRCIGRDHCWCPSNSTGKFCHLPALRPDKQLALRKESNRPTQNTSFAHSMFTLPLSNQLASVHPSLVNVHIHHPPETKVQIHQVARVKPEPPKTDQNSLDGVQLIHSVQQRTQLSKGAQQGTENNSINGNSIIGNGSGSSRQQNRLNSYVGRCFQETVDGQCGKPLPGLTKQDDCCGSIGKSWGLNKCTECPPKPANAVIENGHVKCPKGYKRMNSTHCQDINECLMPGICKNSECLNTRDTFKEICPAGHGYTYSRSEIQLLMRQVEEEELEKSSVHQGNTDESSRRVEKEHEGVIEKATPQSPVQLYPDSSVVDKASINVATQITEIDRCSAHPHICGPGTCVTVQNGYTCYCHNGYQMNTLQTHCVDINECEKSPCEGKGKCVNTAGSYTCYCHSGYIQVITQKRRSCQDEDECLIDKICENGTCVNLEGSYFCSCNLGYVAAQDDKSCHDINECTLPDICAGGVCTNSEGSFSCFKCRKGFRLSEDKQRCEDVNECEDGNTCSGGECTNSPGSYSCSCTQGYELIGGIMCIDVNECLTLDICGPTGECMNSQGSYFCLCVAGYATSTDGISCQDVNECEEPTTCSRGRCLNIGGSYQCICDAGFQFSEETKDCEDIDECVNKTICGSHGFCENTDGSYHCVCDQGFQNSPGTSACVDINECESFTAVCGSAFCENVEGTFLCLCPSDNEEFDPQTNQCRNRIMTEEPKIPKIPGAHPAGEEERKECYYNLNDPGFCDSVLSGNTTKQECCCTVGEGWGDNCETHPCPIVGSAEYSELCPKGNGFLAVDGSAFGLTHPLYSDADECFLFGSEICKNGVCINTVPRYRCICRDGFYYDTVHLECVDLEGTIHLDICWKELIDGYVCSAPQLQRQTTFTECCCMYGVAWSNNCALCPTPTSEEYAMVCNRAVDGLRERPGYEYGPDIPFYSYNVNEPAYGPPELHTGPFYPARHPDREYSSPRVPSGHPRQYNPPLINAFPGKHSLSTVICAPKTFVHIQRYQNGSECTDTASCLPLKTEHKALASGLSLICTILY